MSKLPKVQTSVSTIKLGNRKIKFRAFTGHEEKAILTAKMSGNKRAMFQAFIDVMTACTGIDTSELTPGEFQQLALEIRRVSVGDILEFAVNCKKCGHAHPSKISIEKLEVPDASPITHTFDVGKDENGNEVKLVLRSPTIQMYADLSDDEDSDSELRIIHACVKGIFFGDEAIEDIEFEEFRDWLMSLEKTYTAALLFISTIPLVSYSRKFECLECKEQNTFELKGIRDFFKF